MKQLLVICLVIMCMLVAGIGSSVAPVAASGPGAAVLVSGLAGGSGSAVGPDGALYVPETVAGKISRIDPGTGAVTTFASGLPKQQASLGLGGVMDVAFLGDTAYALVTLVGDPVWGGTDVDGIYRIDSAEGFTVIADIGKWSIENPPPGYPNGYDTATGVQYAMQPNGDGFLVTDGHHNRVLRVGTDGSITQVMQFGDIVPTGLAVLNETIYVAEAGPIPHLPEDGKIVSFKENSPTVTGVAAGAPLLLDVELDSNHNLYGLAQGTHTNPEPGSPSDPNTGSLVRANADGTFTTLFWGLNQPTSMEMVGDTAYVVTLNGEIVKIENVSSLDAVKNLPTAGTDMQMAGAAMFVVGFALLVLGGLLVLKNRRATA